MKFICVLYHCVMAVSFKYVYYDTHKIVEKCRNDDFKSVLFSYDESILNWKYRIKIRKLYFEKNYVKKHSSFCAILFVDISGFCRQPIIVM